MERRYLATALAATLLLALPVTADQPIVDLDLSYAVTAATEPVSCLICPHGDGDHLTACRTFGGGTMDATITVHLLTENGDPYVGYPPELVWLDSNDPGLELCPYANAADEASDYNGRMTISNPLLGGCEGAGGIIMVVDEPLRQPPLDFLFNSPDLNCDCMVNLTDVVFFTGDFHGVYDYRSDFYWDGELNLSDVAILAGHITHACP
jgi:hypothetical protein